MSGVLPHTKHGPESYQVSALVKGGQLVVPDASPATTVSVAGAGAVNVLGVAGTDAQPIPNQAGDTTGYGQPLVDISVLSDYVPVWHGVDIQVTYAANCNFGELLKSAASGAVTPWVDGTDTDPGTIIGRCTQPGGVVISTTAIARARIYG